MNSIPAVGDRVYVETTLFKGYAEVIFIDYPSLYVDEYYPIQVTLEEPDNDGHRVKRVNLKEIRRK